MSASNAGHACRECRRRKGKCDFKLPVCSVCQRYGRHCLYDKHSRSALTRKHLTEVEERLEQTEALLRTVFSEAELAKLLTQTGHLNPQLQSTLEGRSAAIDSFEGSLQSPEAQHALLNSQGDGNPHSSASPQQASQRSPDHQTTVSNEDQSPLDDNLPFAADDDFEWDERETLWTTDEQATGQETMRDADDGLLRKITDGMATLTASASNTGFLGTVSGAALLRQMSAHQHERESSDEPSDMGENRRSSIIDFLSSQMHRNPTPIGSWLRAQPIMTRAYVDTLINLYFAYYHPTFPILHEATFRHQYQNLNERPKGVLHTLASLVAALGSFVSTDASDETDINLFNGVKSQLTVDSLETGSLNLVQAFAMAANYLQKRNRPNSGYNYGGVALRLAISLGLHKEFRNWHAAPLKKEIRRRVWWSLCILDVGATITYGRPLNWPQAGVEAHFPLNIHERDLPINSLSLPPELDNATTYSYVRTQSAYHLATIPIYNRLLTSPLPSAFEMTRMDDDLIEGWRGSLPSYFNDADLPLSQEYLLAHAIGRWRLRIMRIIMYRPFFLRWAQSGVQTLQSSIPEDNATSRCLATAENCITIISRFWATATHTRLAAWYVLYFLLQAVLIPVHCLRHISSHPRLAEWTEQVNIALEIVNAMVDINPNALKCRDIIYKLCGSHLVVQETAQKQPPFEEVTSGLPYVNPGDSSSSAWVTELDTAINHYDISCDHLTNLSGADYHESDQVYADSEAFNLSSFGPGSVAYDFDLGLMLMQ